MEVNVFREEPVTPPISHVVLYFDTEEAHLLRAMTGRISRNNIRQIWHEQIEDDVVDEVFRFVSNVYTKMTEGLKEEE